jgi:hypothetical protein
MHLVREVMVILVEAVGVEDVRLATLPLPQAKLFP